MTLFANEAQFGGDFYTQVAKELKASQSAVIASGYVSNDILEAFKPSIRRLLKSKGSFNLIVGMAYFEGFRAKNYNTLTSLHEAIRSTGNDNSGVKIVYSKRFHGKLYYFQGKETEKIYIGSSNFSRTGLSTNLEATVSLHNNDTFITAKKYMNWLLNENQSAYIDMIKSVSLTDTLTFQETVVNTTIASDEAGRYDVSTLNLGENQYFDILLDRIDKQPKSSLNSYFGKGRWSRNTGIVVPRNWFEVELIVDIETTKHSLYPIGNFTIITDDGYTFECRTQGDYNKNLRSRHSLKVLGKWIKLKLQDSGALAPLTLITSETLDSYGTNFIRMFYMSEKVYYMEFKPDDERYKPE